MNVEQLAEQAGLTYDKDLAFFARLLVAKCAAVAMANDDLFTMSDILEWYEAAQ